MKIIALGDTHGRRAWEQIVNKEEFDKLIFIGDYFDTREDISPEDQIENFNNIVAFKRANVDKVVLLFGNHEKHYLRSSTERYSCYEFSHAKQISDVLHAAIDEGLIQMCHIVGNILFTHAGVTKTWCTMNDIQLENLEQSINDLFIKDPNAFEFDYVNGYDPYGDDICQSPIWIRPKSLMKNKLDGYIQVVGHTTVNKLVVNENVILIDTLGTSGEYLVVENNELIAHKI